MEIIVTFLSLVYGASNSNAKFICSFSFCTHNLEGEEKHGLRDLAHDGITRCNITLLYALSFKKVWI
eukprot:c36565_g1_i1 orf=111-311(-)